MSSATQTINKKTSQTTADCLYYTKYDQICAEPEKVSESENEKSKLKNLL